MKLPDYTVINWKGAVKMFQTVFKRYEKKYIIDGGQYEEVKNYLKQNNIKYTLIANSEDVIDKKEEYINGETDEKLFSNLNSILNHKKVNSKLCFVGKSNLELCKEKKFYLFKYSIDMDNNLIKNINEVSAGDIIYVSPNSALPKLKVLLNEISRVDLEITYLSKLISEEN